MPLSARQSGSPDWPAYLAKFHRERAGAIEEVLQRMQDQRQSPYDWIAEAVPHRVSLVADLASGSGGVARALERTGRTVVCVDASRSELSTAQRRRPDGVFVQGDALRLPLQTGSVEAAVSNVGFSVVRPRRVFAHETARILEPGGIVVATVPEFRITAPSDWLSTSVMFCALRTRPQFPARRTPASLRAALQRAGFQLTDESLRRFTYTIHDHEDAERLISALYLPDVPLTRMGAAVDALTHAVRRRPLQFPIAMRRFVGVK